MFDKHKIIELRQALGLTASEFGALCGVTWNTVFRWEQGIRHPNWRHQEILNKMKKEAEELGLLQSA